ncbi:hypothetical protein F5B19DRAFT_435610, partial [Rostrohypoxylon terebratum]
MYLVSTYLVQYLPLGVVAALQVKSSRAPAFKAEVWGFGGSIEPTVHLPYLSNGPFSRCRSTSIIIHDSQSPTSFHVFFP